MTEIVVYLDALHDIAIDIRRTVRDMDDCVRRAYNEVHSMHDNGRGLNDVRERADDLLRSHRAIAEAGIRVEQSLSQCADMFAHTDQELATMIHTYQFSNALYYQSLLRTTMPNKWSLQYWFEKSAVNVDWLNAQLQRLDVWSLAQRYTWIATLANQMNHETMHNQQAVLATTIDTVMHAIGIPAVLAGKTLAIDALLTQFLPLATSSLLQEFSTTSSFATKIAPITAIVPHVTEELSLFTRELLSSNFRPWAEALASHRADEVVMFGSAILRPLTYVYDATLTGLVAGSNGLCDLRILGADAVQQALTSLPTDFAQLSNSAVQWVTTDLYTIDTQIDIDVSAVVTQAQQLYLQGVSAT
jgi:hypothetical protein